MFQFASTLNSSVNIFARAVRVLHVPSLWSRGSWSRMQRAPAADRNKDVILDVLRKFLVPDFTGSVLEVASGTGQHVVHFAQAFKQATWQPSEVDEHSLKSICAYINKSHVENVREPVFIDITAAVTEWTEGDFTEKSYDAIYNSNMIHIAPWQTAVGLFEAAGYLLKSDGLLFIYGPFANDGVLEPQSNVDFDHSLRARNSDWGIRDITALKKLADQNKLKLLEKVDMPANNKTLVWQKVS